MIASKELIRQLRTKDSVEFITDSMFWLTLSIQGMDLSACYPAQDIVTVVHLRVHYFFRRTDRKKD